MKLSSVNSSQPVVEISAHTDLAVLRGVERRKVNMFKHYYIKEKMFHR